MRRRRQRDSPRWDHPAAGAALGWGLLTVRGRSMEPTLVEGDRLVLRYDAVVRPGDLVLARFPDRTWVIKRAVEPRTTRVGGAAWWLLSDNPAAGVDSRHRGPIPATDVVAVVRLRLPRGLGRRHRGARDG